MDCKTWVYSPQVSIKNTSYAVGGSTWWSNYNRCAEEENTMYHTDIKPRAIYTAIHYNRASLTEFNKILVHLKSCKNIGEILLVHSAFINTYGMVNSLIQGDITGHINELHSAYTKIYNTTREMLVDKKHIALFVTPDNFLKLNNKTTKRPKNVVLQYLNIDALNREVPIILTAETKQCSVSIKKEFKDLFEKVDNEIFKSVAHTLSCYGSMFKKSVTLNDRDIEFFKKKHGLSQYYIDRAPPILIYKKKHSYLSQLFEKTCVLFYKPVELTDPNENLKILKENCSAYTYGSLSVFNTPIMSGTSLKSNMPVFFIENDKVNVDYSTLRTFEFLKEVIRDLVYLKVFIPIRNTNIYELNSDFDIETLECYKDLPDAAKSEELKKKVTNYFSFFIGNVIHLLVANHIRLPFTLSFSYILSIFNFTDINEHRLILISIYLTEKAKPEFVKEVVKIMEDPTHLLRSTFFKRTGSEGVRMNGYLELVQEDANIPLYSTDNTVLYKNFIEFLFRTTIIDYLSITAYVFIKGFKSTMNFDSNRLYPLNTFDPMHPDSTDEQIIDKILKGRVYVCS